MPGSEMVLLMLQTLLLALTWELITNDILPPWIITSMPCAGWLCASINVMHALLANMLKWFPILL